MRTLLLRSTLIVAIAVGLTACDFDVTNPGPVQDEFLDDPGAHDAVVEGANFALSEALWQVSYIGDESARQITRSGRNFCCPKTPPRVGELTRDAASSNTWNVAHEARWTAEDGARRFQRALAEEDDVDFQSYEPAARALLIAGYANRLLGENMCEAVFDNVGDILDPEESDGEIQGGDRPYYERAEQAFTKALDIAQNAGLQEIEYAAHAGRASVRGAGLGDWEGAVSDAQVVPEDFTYEARYDGLEEAQYNHMWWMGSMDPWADWTVFDSFAEEYYEETGDPRTAWRDLETTDSPLDKPMFEQQKYTSRSDNVNLSSGREMLLIKAEAELRNGNEGAAMNYINEVRTTVESDITGEPLEAKEAGSLEEAWTALKDERRVELWLEGRRMGDLRRWIADDTPGEMEDMSERIRLCFPIPDSEVDGNDQIPADHESPRNPIYTGS